MGDTPPSTMPVRSIPTPRPNAKNQLPSDREEKKKEKRNQTHLVNPGPSSSSSSSSLNWAIPIISFSSIPSPKSSTSPLLEEVDGLLPLQALFKSSTLLILTSPKPPLLLRLSLLDEAGDEGPGRLIPGTELSPFLPASLTRLHWRRRSSTNAPVGLCVPESSVSVLGDSRTGSQGSGKEPERAGWPYRLRPVFKTPGYESERGG